MEGRALVTEALLAGSESAEVLSRLGDGLAVETHDDAAEGLATLLNVEVDLVGDLRALGSLGALSEHDRNSNEECGGKEEPSEVEHGDLFVQANEFMDKQGEGREGGIGGLGLK